MKKLATILFALALIASVFACAAYADDTTYSEGYFYYKIEDQSITIVGYFGTETEVTVPASIAGYPVNAIAEGAFAGTGVQVLNLPDTIRSVEQGAAGEASVNYDDPAMQGITNEPAEAGSASTDTSSSAPSQEGSAISAPGSTEETGTGEEVMGAEPPAEPRLTPTPTDPPASTPEPASSEPTPVQADAVDSAPSATPAPAPAEQSEPASYAGPLIALAVVLCGVAAYAALRRKKKDNAAE